MDYAEAAYFDGYHVQHIAAWLEYKRLKRIHQEALQAHRNMERRRIVERRTGGRVLQVG